MWLYRGHGASAYLVQSVCSGREYGEQLLTLTAMDGLSSLSMAGSDRRLTRVTGEAAAVLPA